VLAFGHRKLGRWAIEPEKFTVFDYIERFYNAVRRYPTIGYISLVEFEKKVGVGLSPVR